MAPYLQDRCCDGARHPAIKVAVVVTEGAVLHLRSLLVRLRLANQELRAADDMLEESARR